MLAHHANVTPVGDALNDMADTAAVATLVDLILAVATSVVHLAGALGRPAWIMLPLSPDWRWGLDRDQSRGYPHARPFRQPALRGWTTVIAAVSDALAAFAREA